MLRDEGASCPGFVQHNSETGQPASSPRRLFLPGKTGQETARLFLILSINSGNGVQVRGGPAGPAQRTGCLPRIAAGNDNRVASGHRAQSEGKAKGNKNAKAPKARGRAFRLRRGRRHGKAPAISAVRRASRMGAVPITRRQDRCEPMERRLSNSVRICLT